MNQIDLAAGQLDGAGAEVVMMPTRRDVLATIGAVAVAAAAPAAAGRFAPENPAFRFGCHTMPWGDDYVASLPDIAKAGFKGVQLRASVMTRFGDRPDDLKALLGRHDLTFACFSSGPVRLAPEQEAETLALHESHARFVAAAGGRTLQVTDERPRDRLPTVEDRQRMGGLLTRLGERTAPLGVKVAYHNHMANLGERPEEIDDVLAAADPGVVDFLLDVAHYTQAGGDVAHAIRTHGARLAAVHAKDVRTVPRAAGAPAGALPYQFVELGRGRVDLPGAFAALRDVGYRGWVILELDAVPDAGGTATASMLTSKHYIEQVLKLPL
jgi:inosose dehydratase